MRRYLPATGPTRRLYRRMDRLRFTSPTIMGLGVVIVLIGVLEAIQPYSTATPSNMSGEMLPTPASGLAGSAQLCIPVEQAQVERLLHLGQWEQAWDAATTILAQAGNCPEAVASLRELRDRAAIELLFAAPVGPEDITAQAALADRYRALRADASEPLILRDLQIARRAYDAQLFVLAKAAYDQAWVSESFPRDDRVLVQRYASTLYNSGVWLMRANPADGDEAFRLLVASACIERAYQLSSDASAELLYQMLGPDPQAWPAPAPSPALIHSDCDLNRSR